MPAEQIDVRLVVHGALDREMIRPRPGLRCGSIERHPARGPDIGEIGAEWTPPIIQCPIGRRQQSKDAKRGYDATDGGDTDHPFAAQPLARGQHTQCNTPTTTSGSACAALARQSLSFPKRPLYRPGNQQFWL